MIREWKRLLCLNLILALLVGLACPAMAENEPAALQEDTGGAIRTITASGTCGDSLTWSLDTAGLLLIEGSGDMAEYTETSSRWNNNGWNVTAITLAAGVTSIGSYAFSGFGNLQSISILGSVTKIGSYAFNGCTHLASVSLPDGVVSIGNDAFQNCDALTSILLPDSVTAIGVGAFSSCSSLASVVIGSGITSIGSEAFQYCYSLKTISIGNYALCVKSEYSSFPSGTAVSYNEAHTDEVYAKWDIGSADETDVTAVLYLDGRLVLTGAGTFRGKPWPNLITSVTIGDGITEIPDSEFYSNASLKSVTLGASVKRIGQYAFYNCTALRSIVLPESLNNIGISAFQNCSSLQTAAIPDSVTEAGSRLFAGCSSLASVSLSSGLTSISNNMFSGCSSLTSVTIPDSVTRIEYDAFSRCSSLASVTIPDSVTMIGTSAFSGCSSIKTAVIGKGVGSVSTGIFTDCTALQDVFWNAVNCNDMSGESGAFLNAGSVDGMTLTIGPGVRRIPAYLFFVSSVNAGKEARLKAIVNQSAELRTIGTDAFYRCLSLASVQLGDALVSLGDSAFNTCSSLSEIALPGTLTTIGRKAFFRTVLTGITLGSGVSSIGESAFGECGAGFSISGFSGTPAQSYAADNQIPFTELTSSGAAGGVSWTFEQSTGTLTLSGSGSVDAALSAPWTALRTQILRVNVGSGVTSLGTSAFSGCTRLKQVFFRGAVPTVLNADGTASAAPFAAGINVDVYYLADQTGWANAGWTGCTLLPFTDTKATASLNNHLPISGSTSLIQTAEDYSGTRVSLQEYSRQAIVNYYEYASDADLIGWTTSEDGSGTSYTPDGVFTLQNNASLYAQWRTPSFQIDGKSYSLSASASGTGWKYEYHNGSRSLSLSGYTGGSILFGESPNTYLFISGANTVNGCIAAGNILSLSTDSGSSLTVTAASGESGILGSQIDAYFGDNSSVRVNGSSGAPAVQVDTLTLNGYGSLQVLTPGDTAVSARYGANFQNYMGQMVLSGVKTAVSASYVALRAPGENRYFIYLSAEAQTPADAYDSGPYLRLVPKQWAVSLDPCGGVWQDGTQGVRSLNATANSYLNLSQYGAQLHRTGYVFSGWSDAADSVEYDKFSGVVMQGDLALCAKWAKTELKIGGISYDPAASHSGQGWQYTPGNPGTLQLSAGYSGGAVYATGSLSVLVVGNVTVAGGVGECAIRSLGDVFVSESGGTLTLVGGAGESAVSSDGHIQLSSSGSVSIQGGAGGMGLSALSGVTIKNSGSLTAAGGMGAAAAGRWVNIQPGSSGEIGKTILTGGGTAAIKDGSVSCSSSIKWYSGSSAGDVARGMALDAHYLRFEKKSVIVTVSANYGSAVLTTMSCPESDDNTITLDMPSPPDRFGYRFLGWNSVGDGSGTTYQDGSACQLSETADSLNLYAVWEQLDCQVAMDGERLKLSLKDVPGAGVCVYLAAFRDGCMTGVQKVALESDGLYYCSASGMGADCQFRIFYLDSSFNPVHPLLSSTMSGS